MPIMKKKNRTEFVANITAKDWRTTIKGKETNFRPKWSTLQICGSVARRLIRR